MHRRLGIVGFGLAGVMVVLGAMAGTDLLRRDGAGFGVNAKAFYVGTLGDMFIFGTLILFAFRSRFNPAAHKRLISDRDDYANGSGHQPMAVRDY